jgi:ABC-type transporter Mla subunit MlaD
LKLEIDPGQIQYIPRNVSARIRATTAFGAKYVDLIYPDDPSPERLAAGMVIQSQNVSTEVNTVFQNLTDVLDKIDPSRMLAPLPRRLSAAGCYRDASFCREISQSRAAAFGSSAYGATP